MDCYKPTSRRPIAQLFRITAAWPVRWCVRLGVHPDTVSYASVVAACGAAVCFWQSASLPALLVVGSLLCVVRLWMNMLDGMVALASGRASLRGEIVNELPDRVSDIVIFVGVAHSGLCHVMCGYWAAIAALLTAYVGTLSQAIAGRREFGGLMSKPWRMAAVCVGACITAGLLAMDRAPTFAGGLSVLDATCLLIVVGCLQTVWVRLARTLCRLRENASDDSDVAALRRSDADA